MTMEVNPGACPHSVATARDLNLRKRPNDTYHFKICNGCLRTVLGEAKECSCGTKEFREVYDHTIFVVVCCYECLDCLIVTKQCHLTVCPQCHSPRLRRQRASIVRAA